MIAVVLKERMFDINRIVQKYIIDSLINESEIELAKYGLEEKFWEIISKHFGYTKEQKAKMLLAGIVFRILEQKLKTTNFPKDYQKYTCDSRKEIECTLFMQSWTENKNSCDDYKKLSDVLIKDFKVRENVKNWVLDLDFDLLRSYDGFLIDTYVTTFQSLQDEAKKSIEKRKNTLFYEEYKFTYEALYWGIELNNLIKNLSGIPNQSAESFIKNYAKSYYLVDSAYRKFYFYYQKSENKMLDSVRDFVERAYVNGYLDELSSKFSLALRDLCPSWSIPQLDSQTGFYDKVKATKVKTVVIISDALRYEVAQDLLSEIKKDYRIKCDTSMDFMLGVLPSYTNLGMTALLPHREITMDEKGDYYIDGICTQGSANREKVLKAYNPNSKVLSFDDLDTLSRDELRSTFAGLDIIYIYHNKIDATGDKANTEKDVFNAVDETIQRITEKVKYLFNNSLCGNVMITADHGFLYQYSDLQEHQKITIGTVNNAIQVNKRFVLAKAPINEAGVLHFDMKHVSRESDLIASIPFNINRFKTSGPGINYVHGGASLQEIVIPVLSIRQNKKLEIKKVDVQLTNTSNRITTNKYTLNFFQKEAVSENLMPRKLQVFLLDEETNTKISNDIIIDANIESEEIQSREFKRILELKNFKHEKNKDYSLVIKDVDEDGEPYAKKIFMVDLAFSNEF